MSQISSQPHALPKFTSYALVGIDKAIRIPVGVIVSGLTSRALGVENFAVFSVVLVLVTLISPLASFGLESLGIALAARSAGAATYIRSVGPFRLATGAVAAALFAVATPVYLGTTGRYVEYLAIVAISTIFLLRVHEIGESLLFAQGRLATLAAVRVGAFLAANAVVVAVLFAKPDLSLLLALGAVEAALLLLGYAVLLRSDLRRAVAIRSQQPLSTSILQQLRLAMPTFLSGALVLLLLNLDKLLVYRFMGKDEAGLYISAARLIDVLFFIPMVIGMTHAASFARLAQTGDMMPAYRKAFAAATWLSIAAALGMAACSIYIMPLVFGAPFAGGARVLAFLAPSLVAITWVSLRTRALIALDQRREILRLTVMAGLIHLPLLAVGLRIGSIEAVAISQTAGWLAAAALVPVSSRIAGVFSPLRIAGGIR